MSERVLRRFVRAVIAEAPVSVADADNLALLVQSDDIEALAVVYDPEALLDRLKNVVRVARAATGQENLVRLTKNAFVEPVYGQISLVKSLDPCNGAWEVTTSAAEKKYGPLLYDIAMAMSPTHTIMSDRRSVSTSAKRVWDKYQSRPDVEQLPLDDVEDPKTPPPQDDCEVFPGGPGNPLNSAFKSHDPVATSRLRANHQVAMKAAEKLFSQIGADPADAETYLVYAANSYFVRKYQEQAKEAAKAEG